MTSWRPYLWKEIHQNLRLGLAAMGLFLGITLIPCLIQAIYSKGHWWYSDDGIETILWAGPIFAVIAGLRAMGREQGAIEGFWRSRPVNLQRWLIVKYLTGLAIVWLVCWISVLSPSPMMGMFFNATMRSPYIADDVAMIVPHSFILMLIYSASFVLGQCVRNILHAAILAVGAMAMIFILPLVVAPLHWLSMEIVRRADTQSLDARSFVSFAAGMTAMSIALLWLAGVLLKRNIQIEINGRTLGWSIVGILLVLVAGVAFPMGTNLPAQQVVSLPIDQRGDAYEMAADGNDVLVLLSSIPERGSSRERKYGLVRAHIGEQTSSMDAPIWFADPGQEQGLYYSVSDLMWSGGTSSPAYTLVARGVILPDGTFGGWSHELCTIALDSGEGDPVIHRVPLNPLLGTEGIWPTACVYRQRLYIHRQQYPKAQLLTFSLVAPRLLTFSLADPRAPSLVHSENLPEPIGWLSGEPSEPYRIRLAPIPDANNAARLQITHELALDLRTRAWTPAGTNRIFASVPSPDGGRLGLFETGQTQDDVMSLHSVLRRRIGTLERLLGFSYRQFYYAAGLVYERSGNGVTVYDITNSNRIKRIGHYAAGGFSEIISLPGNRVALAGDRLHILDLSERVSSSAR